MSRYFHVLNRSKLSIVPHECYYQLTNLHDILNIKQSYMVKLPNNNSDICIIHEN